MKNADRWCAVCRIDLSLTGESNTAGVCLYCEPRLQLHELARGVTICPCCKRLVLTADVFHCAWCLDRVCELCVYVEHDADGCVNPDDLCFGCGELKDDCDCGVLSMGVHDHDRRGEPTNA